MFQRILVPLDCSEIAQNVFAEALSIAKINYGSLMLLHVLSDKEVGYPNLRNLDEHLERWKDYQEEGLKFLKTYLAMANKAGVNVEYNQTPGASSYTICAIAKSWKADLIVIGHRGLSGIKELVQGSVSNYVVHHAPCSVLTVYGQVYSLIH
jgi:nucleotide-binding universal stress UspA family protein